MPIYGHKIHVTPWEKNIGIHRKTPMVAWWLDACAVGPKAFALRSHVNGIVGTCADRQTTPQVPRIPVSLFPRRPTAHAQTTKIAPDPSHPKSQEKHTVVEWKIIFCDLMKKQISNLVDKRDVCDVRVTSRPFFTLIHIMKIGCLLPGGRSHEQGMRPSNVVVET